MASLDFSKEKKIFRQFHADNLNLLEGATTSFCALITALLSHSGNISISKIDGRVKDQEECIRKFNRKYRKALESSETEYTISNHISDLIGLRVVCLYEDDIESIQNILTDHFEVIDVTDKISQRENTEDSFGYKGLHLDLKLGPSRREMPEYKVFENFSFEIQIRTIIQDSWSVLDHKIKYKKSIPNNLKRRINTLAALFELADREFREIRSSTDAEMRKEEDSELLIPLDTDGNQHQSPTRKTHEAHLLTAFSFLKIVKHFFKGYDFAPHKVDRYTQEVVSKNPLVTRGIFNESIKDTISLVKEYVQHEEKINEATKVGKPFSVINHCLYLSNKEMYSSMLTKVSRDAFDEWLKKNSL